MRVKGITLQNWRSFGPRGATLDLDCDFVAIVGPNNSGKTALLRSVYELRPVFAALGSFGVGDGNLYRYLRGDAGFIAPQLLPGERIPRVEGGDLPRVLIEVEDEQDSFASPLKALELVWSDTCWIITFVMADGLRVSDFSDIDIVPAGAGTGRLMLVRSPEGPIQIDYEGLAAALREIADSMYVGAFRNAINSGGASYYDLRVGQDFIAGFNQAQNGTDPVASEAVHRMLQELKEIFGFSMLNVSASQDGTHLIYTVDGRAFRGSELGAGIAQFVVVAAMVMIRRPSILLIDEPELNLHASLQQRFLGLLARYVKGAVVFSTHSLGLARTTADKVIVCSRRPDGLSYAHQLADTPALALTLGQLGYGGFHDETFQAVLLVEGVSDVRVYKELLAKYGIRNHVVVLPLGGDALARGERDLELAELQRLSPLVFAVVDSEAESDNAGPTPIRAAFLERCTSAGIECHLLVRRSIENYFDQDLARSVFGHPEAASFGHYDKPGPDWSWPKSSAWRIAARMTREQLDQSDLGPFLAGISVAVHRKTSEPT